MTSQSGDSSLLISAEKSPDNFDSQLGAVVKAMALVGSNKTFGFGRSKFYQHNCECSTSASTSTRIINTPHLRLLDNIRELIRAKNRFRKLRNNTRYPPYKREINAVVRQIRKEIEIHKNRTWKDLLLTLNPQDNSLYNLHRKITKRATVISPCHGPYSDFEKAEAFKDTLEVTFQENIELYSDDKIDVENVVSNYFDSFTTITPPLTSLTEVRGIIKKLQNRKSCWPRPNSKYCS
ncbi:uncharacterized protein TNCV_4451161 [Trichonephila clavipes]|nr:uncharacterized protein TNCV_4451161 [Trichonephila clavipes]